MTTYIHFLDNPNMIHLFYFLRVKDIYILTQVSKNNQVYSIQQSIINELLLNIQKIFKYYERYYKIPFFTTRRTLLHHLKTVKADQGITIWHDEPITSGQAWKPSDESRLDDTDIFLLLISNAFMYSEFIKQLEFKTIIGKTKTGTSNKWKNIEWQKPKFPLIETPIYKDNVEVFWEDKNVRFAYMNNCIGCFHRNPMLLKHMSG